MSFKALLIIDEKRVNVLRYRLVFEQGSDATGKPSVIPLFKGLDLVLETRKDLNLTEWSFASRQTKQLELLLEPIIEGGRIRKIKLFDTHLVSWKTNFSSIGNLPMTETLTLTAAGFEDSMSSGVYSASWRVTFPEEDVAPMIHTNRIEVTPTITKVDWIHPESKEILEESTYSECVALSTQIENPSGNAINITITKKDGTEFEKGVKQLSFSELLNKDGSFELSFLEIKEQWLDFKEATMDALIAKVSHSGKKKQSKPLQIVPPPKVLVNFRTGNSYNGDYGFDWLRMADTGKKGDVFYKDIIGSYSTGSFVQNDAEYIKLGNYFEMPQHPIKSNDKYVVPVLTLLPYKEATLTLKVEIEGSDAKKIAYKYDKTYFKLSSSEVSHKTVGKKELADGLTVKCIKEFAVDQFIEVEADGVFAGKLKILANDKTNRYKADIVFVSVTTELNIGAKMIGSTVGRRKEFSKYFSQLLANASYDTVNLNLSKDKPFNKKYAPKGTLINADTDGFQDYLISALKTQHKKDYSKCYKIFFIDEEQGGLFGRASGIPSVKRSVIVLRPGLTDSTLVHETFHAMGLYHSFSDSGEFVFEKFKTDNIMDYSDIGPNLIPVISTWVWQWSVMQNNLDKE